MDYQIFKEKRKAKMSCQDVRKKEKKERKISLGETGKSWKRELLECSNYESCCRSICLCYV